MTDVSTTPGDSAGVNRAADETNTANMACTNGHAPPEPVDPFPTATNGHGDDQMDMNGRRLGEPGHNPFNKRSTNAKKAAAREAEAAAQAVTEKRLKRVGALRFDAAGLDGRTERWVRQLASAIERHNAGRDPTKDLPEVMFNGDKAVQAGATDAQIDALTPLTPAEIAALKISAAATREHCRAQVRRKAAAMATPRKPLDEVIRHVSDMVNDPPTGTIVDSLIYENTVTHWVGDGGTYKTFTVMGLACSVAAGRDFTNRLAVPERLPVLYFCAERRHYGMGADVAAWCQVNQVDIASLDLLGWDDVVQLADDAWMAELTEFVAERGIKLVVFDTQRKATKGIEENSSTDIGAALANAQKLAMDTNAAVIVIHHTARGQDHARGTTAARDDTDATVVQKATGPNEAVFRIDKHKSEATGTEFPIKVEKVSGTVAGNGDRAGYSYTTMVVSVRDPLTMDETTAKVAAALSTDDKLLVAVVNENTDGTALSPAEVHRRAVERGCTLGKDAAARHLKTLAKQGYGCIAETVNPVTDRRTYRPKASAAADVPGVDGGGDDVSADAAEVVDLAARRGSDGGNGGRGTRARRASTTSKTPPETPSKGSSATPPSDE